MARLRKGSKGSDVRELQEVLNQWIRAEQPDGIEYELVEDGSFGDNTRFVLAKWQAANGHHPSGEIDYPFTIIDSTGGGV